MSLRKQLLHYVLDIGGVFTLTNLYSPDTKSSKDSLRHVSDLRDFWLENGFIIPLKPYPTYKPHHLANEMYYYITKQGCIFLDRAEDFAGARTKSIESNSLQHESCKFDVLISFIRLFPEYKVTIEYPKTVQGIRPDAKIGMIHKTNYQDRHTIYLEIERKKTIDRAFNETVKDYIPLLNGSGAKLLTVYSNREKYPYFIRPQDMIGDILPSLEDTEAKTKALATDTRYGGSLPKNFYFMPQQDFYRLNERVMYSSGQLTKLIN